MFERFTDRARRVVVLAQEEARLLDHQHIGTEHLLLGLLREGEGVAAQVLESLPLDLEDARRRVGASIGKGGGSTVVGHMPFTPRAKQALEMALREALQLGHNYIGTEHLLLGLLRVERGLGAQILNQLVPATELRMKILAAMGGAPGEATEGSERGRERDPGPRCPSCGASLADHTSLRRVEVATDDPADHPAVLMVYCGICDRGLGVLPG